MKTCVKAAVKGCSTVLYHIILNQLFPGYRRMDLRYTFPKVHCFAELGKVPGAYRYCVTYSMQSSKGSISCLTSALLFAFSSSWACRSFGLAGFCNRLIALNGAVQGVVNPPCPLTALYSLLHIKRQDDEDLPHHDRKVALQGYGLGPKVQDVPITTWMVSCINTSYIFDSQLYRSSLL